MATKQGGKGKGRQTPAKALKREACWKRAQERHAANREAQNKRAAGNAALRKAGEPTPWMAAKDARKSIRLLYRTGSVAEVEFSH